MACDGEIAKEEIGLLKRISEQSNLFFDIDVESELNSYVSLINEQGSTFLANYINEVACATLSKQEELQLIKVAIQTIEADENIEYSEVSFFKKIRANLKVSDDEILAELPDKEDYLMPDIVDKSEDLWSASFSEINFKETL